MTARGLPADRLERVFSWGRSTSALSYVYRPSTPDGIREVFALARRHGVTVGPRGAGSSYGDASLNAEQVTLDLSRMRRIVTWDPAEGIIRVEPGVTIRDLWQYVIEDGWWPAVVPGSMYVTVGGAAAMNVHGKNNWKVGPFGDHIREFDLLLPDGSVERCSRDVNPDLFHAAIAGFGMLGCFTSLTLDLKKVHSGLLTVEPLTAATLDAMIAIFEERLDRADYLVGWVDCGAGGRAIGRGQVHQATYLQPGEDPEPARTLRVEHQELPDSFFGLVPKSLMWRFMRPVVNQLGMRIVNGAKYHLGRREHGHVFRQSHVGFAFLLDYVPDWKRALGPGGLIQYQSFIPAARAGEVFTRQLRLAQEARLVPYLGVFKRHRPDSFLMTHGLDGYSLALEFKVTARNRRRLWALAAAFDEIVIAAGGRFYFAKDSTLARTRLGAYLAEERVQRFVALKQRYDPEGLLETNLYRRLFAARPAAGTSARLTSSSARIAASTS
jgi:FAD/FMN-containing dehydrogenase